MKRRKATRNQPPRANWKAHLGWLLGTSLVLSISLAIRYFSADSSATAETRSISSAPATASPQTTPAPTQTAAVEERQSRPQRPDISTLTTMAVVNGEEISREDLAQQCLLRYGEEVLENFVSKHIILQACQAHNVTITNGEIEDEISRMAARFDITNDQWLSLLESERGIDADRYRAEIVWPMLALRRLAAASVEVTQQEYEEALVREFGPRVLVRIIVETDPQRIEELHQRALADPGQFGELAKQFSQDPTSAAQRGIIPPIRHNVGEKEVEDVAFALQPGEISRILHVHEQYFFMQCERHIEETFVPAEHREEVRQEIVAKMQENKMREAATALFLQLEQQAQVQQVLGNEQLSRQMPGVAAVVNGQQITLAQLAEACLELHGAEVLEGEIHRLILLQALRRKGLAVSDQALNAEVARAAESYGYLLPNGSPDIQKWLEHVTETEGATVELYLRDAVWPTVALKELIAGRVTVSEEDLERGFVANYGERVQVQAIVTVSQRQANEVWEMARNNNTEEYFGELAAQYSLEPISQANSGHVPPIRQNGGQPLLEEEAFRLQPGEISAIVNVGEQWIVLRCLGRTKPVVASLEDVRDELSKDILEKKQRLVMAQAFDQLLTQSQIDNFIAGTSQSGERREQGGLEPAVVPASAELPDFSGGPSR